MKTHTGTILRVSNRFGFHSISVKTRYPVVFDPGQYILAWADSSQDDPIPSALFLESVEGNSISISSPAPGSWIPGQQISFRGPLGRGFRIPGLLRRLALIELDSHPGRMMSMVKAALEMKADVVLAGELTSNPQVMQDIPPQVEMTGFEQLTELYRWADLVCLDIPLEKLIHLGILLPDMASKTTKSDIQVLVHTSMPCGGIAECGICSVKTKHGYKLACQDGPVFDLADLSLG